MAATPPQEITSDAEAQVAGGSAPLSENTAIVSPPHDENAQSVQPVAVRATPPAPSGQRRPAPALTARPPVVARSAAPDQQGAATTSPGAGGRFARLGKRTKKRSLASTRPAADPKTTEAPPPPPAPSRRAAGAYERIERALDFVQRPFGPRTRKWVGLVAVVTIAVSTTAGVLFPLLYPNRDAAVFLREKQAELQMMDATDTPRGQDGEDS